MALGFFFSSRRRHTSWPRDWSSDVCSSDLVGRTLRPGPGAAATGLVRTGGAPAPPGGRVHAVGGIGGDGGTGAPGEDGGTGAFGPAVTSVVGGDAPRRCSDKALRSDAVSGRADGPPLRRRARATRWPARPRSVRGRARWRRAEERRVGSAWKGGWA